MKKIKRIRPNMSFAEAAAKLGISESTVLRLVQRGTLHATKPQMWRHHWTRFILEDKAFKDELARRMHGLTAPRRKHIPDTDSVQKEFERKAREKRMNEICEQWCEKDPSPIQTVTETSQQQEYLTRKMTRLEAKVEQAANAALQAQSSAYKVSLSVLDASQKEEICTLHVKHAAEWCAKAQKAYIACAKERRGSLRCAAWCTFAFIIAALILIANLFA